MKKLMKLLKDPEIWAYLIVGILTTIVAVAVKLGLLYTIFKARTDLQIQAAEIISWVVAVAFAWYGDSFFYDETKRL